jgi:hypothetical protein
LRESNQIPNQGKRKAASSAEQRLVEIREDVPHLTIAGQNATWKD